MSTCYSYAELAEILGVKAPLLMLDRLEVLPESGQAQGRKMVSNNEFMFAGHFPGQPVMPGVLQVAAMAQASKALLQQMAQQESGTAVLVSMERVKFRKPVLPGMVLQIAVQSCGRSDAGRYHFQVKNSVDGELASSGNLTFEFFGEDYFRSQPPSGKGCPWPDSMQGQYCDAQQIMSHIPHRIPFLLVDRMYAGKDRDTAYGFKNITGNDILGQSVQRGFFPGYLQVEALAQLGCAELLRRPENAGKLGMFMSIDEAHFESLVFPGEQLLMYSHCEFGGRFGIAEGELYVEDRQVGRAKLKFAILKL